MEIKPIQFLKERLFDGGYAYLASVVMNKTIEPVAPVLPNLDYDLRLERY